MFIADQLKRRSVSEYLLYMWQVEDLVRAYGLDAERMGREYVPQFGLDEERSERLKEWYEGLIGMMREEGVTERGHLQVNRGVVMLLEDLHGRLLRTGEEPEYAAVYYRALPYIVELRRKEGKAAMESPGNERKEGEKEMGTADNGRKEGEKEMGTADNGRKEGERETEAAMESPGNGRKEGEREMRTADNGRKEEKGEIERGLEVLYGVMMLRLQRREISAETSAAVDCIAKWIALLSEYYKKEKSAAVNERGAAVNEK